MYIFHLDQAMVLHAAKLRDASNKNECDKNSWAAAIDELGRKIKVNWQRIQLALQKHLELNLWTCIDLFAEHEARAFSALLWSTWLCQFNSWFAWDGFCSSRTWFWITTLLHLVRAFYIIFFFIAVAQCEDLKLKYSEEHVKRKKLYNQIQEARGTFFNSFMWKMIWFT